MGSWLKTLAIQRKRDKKKFAGVWVSAATYAALRADARRNNRSVSGEIRARISANQDSTPDQLSK